MRTAIMTDTNSGLNHTEAASLGVFVIPMPVIIDEQTFFEGETIAERDFYEALCSGRKVTTSMPAPGDLLERWDSVLEQGYDEIVYIPMSSGLSNSCQAATVLAKEYGKKVYVVDNHRISVPLKESVYTARKLAQQNVSGEEIKEYLEQDGLNASIYIAVDTLEYLKKGGRITPAAAALGTVLNLKPVLQIQGAKLDAFAKVRGWKAAKKTMLDAIEKDIKERFSGKEIHLEIAYTCTEEAAEEWKKEVSERLPGYEIHMDKLSLSVACHIGAGSMAVACSKKIEV